MDLSDRQNNFKILLGDNNAGKSPIIIHYSEGFFLEWTVPTPQMELIKTRHQEVELGVKVELQLLEAGDEFWSSTNSFLPRADGFLLASDLGNKTSFENAKYLHKEVCTALQRQNSHICHG